jgi:hypothetical protein
MKKVSLNKNAFWYNGNQVQSLDMASGKHVRFSAIDSNYGLSATPPNATQPQKIDLTKSGPYYAYPIDGKKGEQYIFQIVSKSPAATVPQMIVKVD